jgi:hypothetical protein
MSMVDGIGLEKIGYMRRQYRGAAFGRYICRSIGHRAQEVHVPSLLLVRLRHTSEAQDYTRATV